MTESENTTDTTTVMPADSHADTTLIADQHASSATTSTQDFPQKLGKYHIEAVLGEGAMGVVYRAIDPLIERTVAIKTIRKDLLDNSQRDEMLARFKREAQAAGKLSHPGIVPVYEYDEEGETAYISMEFIHGEELSEIFNRGEKPKYQYVIDIIIQLLEALDFAHQKGIVHRDIKPSNIIITMEGKVKLTDFGIAHIESSSLTQSGTVLGTPAFMSPEQCLGGELDSRSDLFSVGAVMYYMLTGEKPFPGDNIHTIMQRVINRQTDPPTQLNPLLDSRFDPIIARALAKNPLQRYQTAKAFIDDIQAIKNDQTVSSSTVTTSDKTGQHPPPSSTGKIISIISVVIITAAVAGGYFFTGGFNDKLPKNTVTPAGLAVVTTKASNPPEPTTDVKQVISTPAEISQPPLKTQWEVSVKRPKAPPLEANSKPSLQPISKKLPIGLKMTANIGDNQIYQKGDIFQATVKSDSDAFLYCFHQDYAGIVVRVLPNRFTRENFIPANQFLQIPGNSDQFEIIMEQAGSTEILACMASSIPLNHRLSSLAAEDLSAMQQSLEQIEEELHAAAEQFTVSKLILQVRP